MRKLLSSARINAFVKVEQKKIQRQSDQDIIVQLQRTEVLQFAIYRLPSITIRVPEYCTVSAYPNTAQYPRTRMLYSTTRLERTLRPRTQLLTRLRSAYPNAAQHNALGHLLKQKRYRSFDSRQGYKTDATFSAHASSQCLCPLRPHNVRKVHLIVSRHSSEATNPTPPSTETRQTPAV